MDPEHSRKAAKSRPALIWGVAAVLLVVIGVSAAYYYQPASVPSEPVAAQAPQAEVQALIQRARAGDAAAQAQLGYNYQKGIGVAQSDTEALKWYRRAADQDHARAQNNLGVMYGSGRGVAQNDTEALKWYRRAAEQGFAAAQTNLGFMYTNGRGVAQSDTEALKWYRRAAEQGFAIAQSNLGFMYASGRGVPKDLTQAYIWYAIAKALRQIESLEPNMTRQQIAEAKRRAEEWKKAHDKR